MSSHFESHTMNLSLHKEDDSHRRHSMLRSTETCTTETCFFLFLYDMEGQRHFTERRFLVAILRHSSLLGSNQRLVRSPCSRVLSLSRQYSTRFGWTEKEVTPTTIIFSESRVFDLQVCQTSVKTFRYETLFFVITITLRTSSKGIILIHC